MIMVGCALLYVQAPHSSLREPNNPLGRYAQIGQIWPQGTWLTLFSWPEKEFWIWHLTSVRTGLSNTATLTKERKEEKLEILEFGFIRIQWVIYTNYSYNTKCYGHKYVSETCVNLCLLYVIFRRNWGWRITDFCSTSDHNFSKCQERPGSIFWPNGTSIYAFPPHKCPQAGFWRFWRYSIGFEGSF